MSRNKDLVEDCLKVVESKFDLVLYATQITIDEYYRNDTGDKESSINQSLKKISNQEFDAQRIKKAIFNRFSRDRQVFFSDESIDKGDETEVKQSNVEEITFEDFVSEEIN